MKKVSIIVPVYNVENDLWRCVESILSQSYNQWELWLIDDGSTDSSSVLCDGYASKDDRIHVLHKTNGGVSSARNVGIERVSGDYVLFVDSDDYLESSAIEKLLIKAEKADADVVLCGFTYRIINDNSSIMNTAEYSFEGDNAIFFKQCFWEIYKKDLINPPWNKLIKRSVIEENKIQFNTDFSILEDVAFSVQVLEKCEKIVIIEDALYNYCFKQQGSLVSKFHPNFFEALVNLDDCLKNYFSSVPEIDMEWILHNIFFQKSLAYLRKMYRESKYSNKRKYAELCRLCNHQRFRECVQESNLDGIGKRLVKFCVKNKFYRSLHLLYLLG